MNVALLLLGPGNLRQNMWSLSILGGVLVVLGLAIVVDASDTVTVITLEAFGWIMVAMGLGKLALSVYSTGGGMQSLFGFQGFILVALGMAVADFPMESKTATPWLLGIALLANGLYQVLSAVVIRYPNWPVLAACGGGQLALGGLMFLHWKDAVDWVAPLLLGISFTMTGFTTLHAGLRMNRYRKDSKTWTVEGLMRYFLDFHVPRRFYKHYLSTEPKAVQRNGEPHGHLLVHIWTPSTVAGVEPNPNPIDRYVATKDPNGKVTVGHAALEMAPDIYISHCDGDPTPFEDGDEVWKTLRSRDVSGVFLPSFEEELKTYIEPSISIRFRKFREDQLRTFWELYRTNTSYNFTNRNCSVAVALALEASLMGCLADKKSVRTLLSLMTSKDFWMASFMRWKAREMIWTPGMMMDYTLALHRLVESEG